MKYFVMIIIVSLSLLAQNSDPFEYYPYHVGDIWQYLELSYEYPQGLFREEKITRIDTIDNGKAHLIYYNNSEFPTLRIIPDSARVYSADSRILFYILNEAPGFIWERKIHEEWIKYFQDDEQELWGLQFQTKIFYNYYWYAPDSLSDWAGMGEVLAKNIGLQRIEWEGGREELIGCLINGIGYGTLTDTEKLEDVIPAKHDLLEAYPNPFNGFSILNYNLPFAEKVTITIYDILGRKIETLINTYLQAGEHKIIWKPESISSGIYLAVLSTSTNNIISKLIYQK